MRLLCILLTVMSWVVETKSSVSSQGTPPDACVAQYSCTYQKGTVRKDDVATLTLTSLGNITIDAVDVYIRSNKDAGAGVLTLTVNESQVATKEGSLKDWIGSFDNSNFHPITLLSSPVSKAQELEISLQGTANSLYIEKYVITYTPAVAHTVTLMRGDNTLDELTEEKGGVGVLLPSVPDVDGVWHFLGWSEVDFGTINIMPENLHTSSTRFYPASDCSLWAAFEYQTNTGSPYLTDLQSGVYMYVNSALDIALSGKPHDGIINAATLNAEDANLYYHVDFIGTDTAYITHVPTETPIGYSGTKMAAVASPWLVFHDGEETIFYMKAAGKNYVLWLNIYDTSSSNTYAGLLQADPKSGTPMRLQTIAEIPEEPTFTCHPEWALGLEETKETLDKSENTSARFLMHFGNYELIIENGRKILRQQ